MFELDGIEYSVQDLERAANKYGMDFNSYLETMKEKGLVEVQSDSSTEPSASGVESDDFSLGFDAPNVEHISEEDFTNISSMGWGEWGFGKGREEIMSEN